LAFAASCIGASDTSSSATQQIATTNPNTRQSNSTRIKFATVELSSNRTGGNAAFTQRIPATDNANPKTLPATTSAPLSTNTPIATRRPLAPSARLTMNSRDRPITLASINPDKFNYTINASTAAPPIASRVLIST